jgi:hypothetical protein
MSKKERNLEKSRLQKFFELFARNNGNPLNQTNQYFKLVVNEKYFQAKK